MELLGQILGIASFIIAFMLYQMKDRKTLLYMQTLLCAVVAFHYLFLKAYPGMALNFIGIVRNIVYYRKDIFKGRIWPMIMSAIMLAVGILTSSGIWSILVVAGLVINTYCLSFNNNQHFRMSILVTSPMVLIYNIFIFSVGGIMMESISIISAIIGLVRFSRKKKTL